MIVLKCDITCLEIDIIVNVANKYLSGGSGVDGIIHHKAEPELKEECIKLNGCETGEAKITNGYKLPVDKVIHAVGPIYKEGKHNEEELLKNAYINSMELAEKYRKENNKENIIIAFPSISTGVYGYPKDKASKTVVDTIRKINNPKIKVVFVCFSNVDYQLYLKNLYGIKLECSE
jgi:O-acetyl-ADP-ribose deacetylase (regulator of RNase III)